MENMTTEKKVGFFVHLVRVLSLLYFDSCLSDQENDLSLFIEKKVFFEGGHALYNSEI